MRARKRLAENALVVAIGVGTLIELWVSEVPESKLALSAMMLVATAGLLLHRRYPLAGPLAVFVAFATTSSFVAKGLQSLAVPILLVFAAAWVIGRENDRSRAMVGLALGFAGIQILGANLEDAVSVGDVIFFGLLFFGPWFAGQLVRNRETQAQQLRELAVRLDREREQRARAAVADERLRIARELHDVVAHSISVMTIQAGAARLLLDDDPEQAEQPLLRVEETGHETLSEMRRLLGVLHSDAHDDGLEARPSLTHLHALVDQFRAAGLPVELDVEGDPHGLAAGVDLAAYRVVQEGLTNVLKHAGPATARVIVRCSPEALELGIVDDGHGRGADTGGHGLIGMRERVAIYGGELEAGKQPGKGYAVRAHFPLRRNGEPS
jgi:signal transduction histidine kinase